MSPSVVATVPVASHDALNEANTADTLREHSGVPDMTINLRRRLVSQTKEGGVESVASRFVLPKCALPPHDEFQPVENFVARALGAQQGEADPKAYRAVLDCVRRREDPPMLRKVLLALRTAGNGSALHQLTLSSQKHAHLLHLLFRLDPFSPPASLITKQPDERSERTAKLLQPVMDGSLAEAHLHLLLAVVSANSVFLTPGMNTLWRLIHQDLEDAPEMRTSRMHAALSTMLRLCPKGNQDLFPILASNFPFRTKPTGVLVWYTKQCLAVLEYVPTLHAQVLELLIDKCLEMDVEIKINDGGTVSIEKEMRDAEEEMFELDLDDDEPTDKIEDETVEEKVDEMADKLDSLMNILLHHIQAYVSSNKDGARNLYRMISPVFDSSVLTTHRSKFVQFVIFVVCGLEHERIDEGPFPQLDREFAAKLIDIVLDPYRATVTRQSGACYLASFMSRASYVSPETICEAVSALLRWAEAYIMALSEYGARASDARDQCDMHSLFYTVCQASFYIMCFRGAEAMQYYRAAIEYHSTHGAHEVDPDAEIPYADPEHVDIRPERWAQICGHELQPLRFCLESVRGEFLHVAGVFQLLPPQLLHRLAVDYSRLSTGTPKLRKASVISTAVTLSKRRMKGGVGGMGQGSNPLDSFFPFDPYLLRQSHSFIELFYKNWEGSIEEDAVLEDDDDDDETSQDDGSDVEDNEDGGDDDDDEDNKMHMPQSVDSGAHQHGMSYTSNATNMSHSTRSSFQPETPERDPKVQFPPEAWSETLKRARAPSIENGSW